MISEERWWNTWGAKNATDFCERFVLWAPFSQVHREYRNEKKKLKKSQRIVILICEYRALISWFALIGLVLNERSYNSENHDTLGAYVTIDSAAFYSEHVRWLRIGICCDFVFVTHRDFVAHRGSKTRQYCSLTRKIGGLKTHFSA